MTREITIRPVLNGFVVTVGCQTVCFDSRSRLIGELGRYLENPDAVEAEYRKNAINDDRKMEQPLGLTGEPCGQRIARIAEEHNQESVPTPTLRR